MSAVVPPSPMLSSPPATDDFRHAAVATSPSLADIHTTGYLPADLGGWRVADPFHASVPNALLTAGESGGDPVIVQVPFEPPNRPPPPPPPSVPPTAPFLPVGPNRPITIHTTQPWSPPELMVAPMQTSPWLPSPPSASSDSDPGPQQNQGQEEEDELERVLALSKLTALSETVSRSWSEGAEPAERVELELDDRELDQLERTRREDDDLRRAMEESLKVTTSPSREHWVEPDFWEQASSPRSPAATTATAHLVPASPSSPVLARSTRRSLPPPPPPPPLPPPPPPPFSSSSLSSSYESPIRVSQSYPDRMSTASFSSFGSSPSTSPRLGVPSPPSRQPRQPIYARTSSLPNQSSTSLPSRSGSSRRQGSTPPLSLYVANPSDDTPLPDFVEASYANKGAAELFRPSALPTIRGDQWEGASVDGYRTPPPPLTPSDEDAGRLIPVNEGSALDEDDDDVVDVEGIAGGYDLEPDEQEIELQKARRDAMARDDSSTFLVDEDEEPSPLGSGSSTSGTVSSGGTGGLGMVREPSSSSSLAPEEEEEMEDEEGSILPYARRPSDEGSWGGLAWGYTSLSPPLTPSAPPLTVNYLPPSSSLSIIFPPPKGEGAFFIKAPSYGALLSGLFVQAKTTIVGSGSYHLAVQFVKLSAASAAESGQEFSTILWIEDAGLESSPLSPTSPHGLAGPHNSFRSSRFSTSSSSSSLSSLVPSYTPAPSYIVRTSSHLLHTLLLQPSNATHSSRYNTGSPSPQPHHTATLALPMCTPPTSTIHQLVDHLLSLTTTSQGTKSLSRRLNSLITQFTPAGGGVSASSALARFGTDLFGGTASETASVNSHGGGGGGGSGLPGTVTDGVLGGEDWYDDADDRGIGNGGTGVRSWLKSKRTIIVHRASVRTGHGAAAQAGRRKSETFEAASFITPFSIPESVDEQPARSDS